MGKIDIKDVSPLLKMVRNFLLGREHVLALRFSKDLATRSPPDPQIPDGPTHKLSANYYYSRDARREVAPPEIVASNTKQLSTSSEDLPTTLKSCTPGSMYKWD